jgi:hypothetical protein
MNQLASCFEALDPDERRVVYERLWLELTIAGRAVWSDPGLSETEKLDGLKWLNEIQHRVWGAHQSPAHYAASDLVANVQACWERPTYHRPRPRISSECDTSYNRLTSASRQTGQTAARFVRLLKRSVRLQIMNDEFAIADFFEITGRGAVAAIEQITDSAVGKAHAVEVVTPNGEVLRAEAFKELLLRRLPTPIEKEAYMLRGSIRSTYRQARGFASFDGYET